MCPWYWLFPCAPIAFYYYVLVLLGTFFIERQFFFRMHWRCASVLCGSDAALRHPRMPNCARTPLLPADHSATVAFRQILNNERATMYCTMYRFLSSNCLHHQILRSPPGCEQQRLRARMGALGGRGVGAHGHGGGREGQAEEGRPCQERGLGLWVQRRLKGAKKGRKDRRKKGKDDPR